MRNKSRIANLFLVLAILVLIVLGVQIVRMKQQEDAYAKRQKELEEELLQEEIRATELQELEQYMKSTEYVEDLAKSKLGLAYSNEIIFKESGN